MLLKSDSLLVVMKIMGLIDDKDHLFHVIQKGIVNVAFHISIGKRMLVHSF